MNEFEYLDKCCNLIEERLGWGSSEEWKNSNFLALSKLIFEKTKVTVSSDTLKRLFGKKKTYKELYTPQVATKNALALFLDFKDWNAFINSQTHTQDILNVPLVQEDKILIKKNHTKRNLVIAGFFVVLAASIFYFISSPKKETEEKDIKFSAEVTKGKAPLAVRFFYDIDQTSKDSFYLDLGYDEDLLPKERIHIPLSKSVKTITESYETPGYYHARLMRGKKIIKSIPIHAQTTGWESQIVIPGNYESYITIKNKSGIMHADPEEVKSFGISKSQRFYIHHRNSQNFNADGDNFDFEIRAKNNEEEGGLKCYDIKFELVGENEKYLIHFLQTGCFKWTKLKFSEKFLDGKHDNLSGFGKDVNTWKTIKLSVKNKKATVYFEGKPMYETTYEKPIGKIKVIDIFFKGCGSVDYTTLMNPKGDTLFFDGF